MPDEKKDEVIKAVIDYSYPEDLMETYATGARILLSLPHNIKLNFFWDKMQDEVSEEIIVQKGEAVENRVSKRAKAGRIKREFVASVTVPIPTFKALLKVMNDIDKEVFKHDTEEKKE